MPTSAFRFVFPENEAAPVDADVGVDATEEATPEVTADDPENQSPNDSDGAEATTEVANE